MRFVCDSCRAQYMISDDKVGAKGVKVRCKKCGYNIVVRPSGSEPVKEEGTSGEAAGGAAASQNQPANDGFGLPPTLGTPPEGGIFSGVEDDELGAVFDQVLNSGSHRIPAGEASGPAQLDSSALSDAGETVRKLAEAEGNAKSAASHEWFVAIDEKQVGPLSMDKVKDYWDRGEVGPDSLCWRAGFSDWIPLSEATELASVLAPRPTKPVIVEPAPVASSAPVASGPVESAFASGLAKPAKSDTPAPVPTAQETGWKPSAASVLASLVKEENEALSKPASKAAPVEEKKGKPAASGLLDVPPPEAAPVAAQSPLMAEPPAPAPYMQPAPAPAYAQPPPQAYAQPMAQPYPPQQYAPPAQPYAPPPGYPGYPQAAPAPKQGGKMGMIIGAAAAVLLLVGGGAFFATRSSEQPPPVTPPAATQPMAQAPSKPVEVPPTPPPPTAVAQNTATPAAGTAQPAAAATQPATAPATAPTTAPAVAAAGTPGTTPAAATTTPPPATEPAKTEPQQVARAEVPSKRTPATSASRPAPTRTASNDDEEPVRSKPQPAKSGGSADDEFDELFGTKKPSSSAKSDTVSANGRTAYIPPEPGGGGAAQEKLGQSDIMQVVLANKPAIIKCVNEQKKKDPGLSGKLVMRWTIQTNGKTKNVSCQTSEFRTTYMATCISGLIKGWSFPKHKVQGDPIDFPFTF
ncbi:MAG TPA: adventurous gliding motility protein GltJ [Archangium sp.]|uniref:adventurous gliding motility protein GltJ n=1 Tax=Archangium sp. TaxID=1872627 RepID=UPI002E372179|nr:adventurous gliding motility protein GltJ [Archangium sp.]HEX5749760.1 adventurous gliding motility protein GltJ [Archangium sp.]